jgi:hypothetical protein
MDRAPGENTLDPVERVSPASGANDTGDVGDESARIYKDRDANRSQRKDDRKTKAPEGDQAPGRRP